MTYKKIIIIYQQLFKVRFNNQLFLKIKEMLCMLIGGPI